MPSSTNLLGDLNLESKLSPVSLRITLMTWSLALIIMQASCRAGLLEFWEQPKVTVWLNNRSVKFPLVSFIAWYASSMFFDFAESDLNLLAWQVFQICPSCCGLFRPPGCLHQDLDQIPIVLVAVGWEASDECQVQGIQQAHRSRDVDSRFALHWVKLPFLKRYFNHGDCNHSPSFKNCHQSSVIKQKAWGLSRTSYYADSISPAPPCEGK